MGCIQSKASGTNEESRRLTRNSTPPTIFGSGSKKPENLNRLSTHIPNQGPLTQEQYWDRLDFSPSQNVKSGNVTLNFAFVTQRGYYPDTPDKPNQDAVYVKSKFGGHPDQHFFAVFDGHGVNGEEISHFAKYKVPDNALEHPGLSTNPEEALHHAMTWTNDQLHQAGVGDEMSGTTAISCLFLGNTAWIANVGDSRAILVSEKDGIQKAEALSEDQTPFRRDELERVREAGAVVLSLDQVEGSKPKEYESWTEEKDAGDPPRVWKPECMYPGTAFTRSIGDRIAEEVGVTAVPEIRSLRILPEHKTIIIASDGVTEFLTNEQVATLVSDYDDPQEAAIALVAESYHLWLSFETRTDDISAIVIHLSHPQPELIAPPRKEATGALSSSKSFGFLDRRPQDQDQSSQTMSSLNTSGLTENSKSTLGRVLSRLPSRMPSRDGLNNHQFVSQRLQDVINPPEDSSQSSSRRLRHSLSEPKSLKEKNSASRDSAPIE